MSALHLSADDEIVRCWVPEPGEIIPCAPGDRVVWVDGYAVHIRGKKRRFRWRWPANEGATG